MQKQPKRFLNPEEFVPELKQVFQEPPLDPGRMVLVAIAVEKPDTTPRLVPAGIDRHLMILSDGEKTWEWKHDSLRSLFRGDRQPPNLGDYPAAYQDSFLIFDLHVLEISNAFGDRRDAEMLEIYSNLRRRPDGRSLGFVHDYLWQAAALLLGTRILSQAEFEAILARLERSCRTFSQGPTSRNYVATLRKTFERAGQGRRI